VTGRFETVRDPVPDADATAREIGFALPARYNASRLLFDNVASRGDAVALRSLTGEITYCALADRAMRIGQALLAAGLERGDRVLLLLDDVPDYAAAIFGAMRAGLVPMLINTLSTPDLLQFYLEDSGARAAIVDGAFAAAFAEASTARGSLLTVLVANAPDAAPGMARLDDALAGMDGTLPKADTHRDDMAFWMYSSGSTGRPKGVVHLQHDLAYTAESYGRHVLRLTGDDICFSVPKIFFAYGLGNTLTFPFAAGASSILMPGRPDPAAILTHIERLRPTVFFGLPTLYTALLNAPEAKTADLSSVRLWISAAEVLANEIAGGWAELTGKEIVEGLGSTEMTHIYLSNTEEAKRAGSAGRRVPGYDLKLTDRDGNPTPAGEEGILWIKGHSSAPCYWNRPDKTAETMRGEWLWTGDRFHVDADGFHYFRGRADDLIKVSGQWVYPLEVELCLADHPHVMECAVLAHELADRRMTLRAIVALKDGAMRTEPTVKSLQAFVKAKLLPYKYPRIIEFVDALPKTGTGKIDRQALVKRPLPQAAE
jgi:benzoate-CoA ligase family protein